MKKLLVLSGKGGTGKTTVAAALIDLFGARAFADCDVDAPNLHLVKSGGKEPQATDFYGSKKAVIDRTGCTACGACQANCRFHAIKCTEAGFFVDEYACEGCGVCEYVCPENAVHLKDDIAGKLMLYQEDMTFSTAELKMGRGNSGKLVAAVKKQLDQKTEADFAIIDGSPGIGCPVIASVSGVDMVLVVAEPSRSGISDMERILQTVERFEIPVAVCINKYDIAPEKTEEIIAFCQAQNIPFVGKIPLDDAVVRAQNSGSGVTNTNGPAAKAIREIYQEVKNLISI